MNIFSMKKLFVINVEKNTLNNTTQEKKPNNNTLEKVTIIMVLGWISPKATIFLFFLLVTLS